MNIENIGLWVKPWTISSDFIDYTQFTGYIQEFGAIYKTLAINGPRIDI